LIWFTDKGNWLKGDRQVSKLKYFVSSDVHGFYDEWVKALEEKQFNIDNPDHMIVLCGDLFDRGTEPEEAQSFVMRLLRKKKIILVRGNHEDLALELIDNYYNYMFDIKNSHHWHNGTFQTLLKLTGMDYNSATTCLLEFKRRAYETDYVKRIIPKMRNFYETEHYVFTHAWVPIKENGYGIEDDWRNASEYLWEAARWLNPAEMYRNKLYLKDKTIVSGHKSCSLFWADMNPLRYTAYGDNACFEPFITKEVIALDAHTVLTKKVNVVVLED